MAHMIPAVFPHDLARHPELAGEARVYVALEAALSDRWHVFYNRTVGGVRRRIDFILIDPARGMIAIEVKGGLVHVLHGCFRQVVHGKGTRPGQRKRIHPFQQTRKALDALLAVTGVAAGAVPIHIAAVFPRMSARAFPWGASPHLFFAETLESAALTAAVERMVPAETASDSAKGELYRMVELLGGSKSRQASERHRSDNAQAHKVDR